MTDDGGQTTDKCSDPPSVVRLPSSGGAIAQLGERLLCKQEVVGSIPSGSTSREPCSSVLTGFSPPLAGLEPRGRELSDIVKRKIDPSATAPAIRSSEFARTRARAGSTGRGGTLQSRWSLTARRRTIFASWSFYQCRRTTDDRGRTTENPSSVVCLLSSGWALIMRAIKCLKGVWWMPWR